MSSSRPCQVHLTVVKGACSESSSLLGVWQNRPHWGLAAWPVGYDCCSSRSGRGRNTVMQAVIMATEMGQAQDPHAVDAVCGRIITMLLDTHYCSRTHRQGA